MNGANSTLRRREFVTRTAMLLFSGAILGACDEPELGDCIDAPDMDEPACPEPDALEPAEAEPAAPVDVPETFPAEDDDLLFLRSLE